jgi:hypothetical protein
MQMNLGIHSLAKIWAVAVLLTAASVQSQQPAEKQVKPSSLELTYDYIHSNGPPGNCGCFVLNGGAAAYVFPLQHSNFALVGRLGASHDGGIGASNYDLTLLTYTAGVRYLPHTKWPMFQPYGEVQAGGAHAGGSLSSAPGPSGGGLGSAFAGSIGGGIDLHLHKQISLKLIDAEYLATTYANGSNDHQNNLRISAGIVLSFCSSKKCGTKNH